MDAGKDLIKHIVTQGNNAETATKTIDCLQSFQTMFCAKLGAKNGGLASRKNKKSATYHVIGKATNAEDLMQILSKQVTIYVGGQTIYFLKSKLVQGKNKWEAEFFFWLG